jgi:hypothetical protein
VLLRLSRINTDQPFDHPDSAAKYILPIINRVTRVTGLEVGGFIYQEGDQFFIRNEIYVGTRSWVLQMSNPPDDPRLVAGFHTHPSLNAFSSEDASWAGDQGLLLYMINRRNEISLCVPAAANCFPNSRTRQPGTPLQ